MVSRCISFDACRYNGRMIESPVVEAMKPHAEMIAVCPEVEIGLGVPRDPLKLVAMDDGIHLVQPSSCRDLTEDMHRFADRFIGSLESLDGLVLKARSPSCGPKGVGIFPSAESDTAEQKGRGLFAAALLRKFGDIALAEEQQLGDPQFCDHFLTRVYMLADFRELRLHESGRNLLQFHAENKYLLVLYGRREYRALTSLLANREERSFDALIEEYRKRLFAMLGRRPSMRAHFGVLKRAAEHLIPHANEKGKEEIQETIGKFESGELKLYEVRWRFRNWIEELDEDYLAHQTYFRPYPDLIALSFA